MKVCYSIECRVEILKPRSHQLFCSRRCQKAAARRRTKLKRTERAELFAISSENINLMKTKEIKKAYSLINKLSEQRAWYLNHHWYERHAELEEEVSDAYTTLEREVFRVYRWS